jgi:hypothetical protein
MAAALVPPMAEVEPPKYIYEYQQFRGKAPPKNGYNWQLSNTPAGSRLPIWKKIISKKINPAYTKFYNNKMNELSNLMGKMKIANNNGANNNRVNNGSLNNGRMKVETKGGTRKTRRKTRRSTRRKNK